MAINWSAYEAAKELYGDNKENIIDIGSRYPLFARTVMAVNSDYLLDILQALPKVTARVVESGLKDMEDSETEVEEESKDEAPKKETAKKTKKSEPKEEEDETGSYEDMTAKELYKLCCERGISSKCKSRSKDALIKVLEAYDNGEFDSEKESKSKKTKADKPKTKKSEPVEEEDDDWGEEEEEETDPYAGKSARELYKMCCDRGIKTKQKLSADAYAKLLKKADEEATEETEEEEDDDWEI